MKKLFTLFAVSLITLAGCNNQPTEISLTVEPNESNETNIPTSETDENETEEVDENALNEVVEMATYDHSRYSIKYPENLNIEELFEGVNSAKFYELDQLVMEVSMSKGNQTGTIESATPTGDTLEFNNGTWTVYTSPGDCDGPGCGAPYLVYEFYHEEKGDTFFIEFINLTEETELSKEVASSFEIK